MEEISSNTNKPLANSKFALPTHNLPTSLSSFIGRERELVQIKNLLTITSTRLVTLTGAGGIGKTRLALQAARDLHNYYANGVWFVELAPLSGVLSEVKPVTVKLNKF